MKYADYIFLILGNTSLIFSFFDNTSAMPLFAGFGILMITYSGMNINQRYRNKSNEEAQIKLYSASETPNAE
tara:strand:- start:413 stop:628 length:216 start_codon:yes stop_codon:yes gene_type:complete